MKLLMLISLLPAVMAEFDSCLRPNGEWAGFDQVIAVPLCTPPHACHLWDTRIGTGRHRVAQSGVL